MLTVGSLFSGIGGLDLGLERAGMKVLWQVEIDDYCNKVLEKHWPGVRRYGDIKGIRWSEVEPVDLICGGFPCQPVSVAGARRGDEDERWLWPEFLRAVREVRPRYAFVENVPGLLSAGGSKSEPKKKGRLARRVFGDLAEIGYNAEWNIISAQDVGAPHIRQRLWIVAYPHSKRLSRPSISIFERGPRQEDRNACRTGQGDVPDANRSGLSYIQGRSAVKECDRVGAINRGSWWDVESPVGRVADGVPSRVDRLKCLGNAVVPQVAEYIGRLIVEADGT